eukprot:Hpha_TRINITY_DN15176_c0_g4::TRINITY_DN15176_c0_g4_i1::g.127741::m.127741/K11600/RRP41, EXOSC4, SKI6; exosome complex component RRP41
MPPRARRKEYLTVAGFREDGRRAEQVRDVQVVLDSFGHGADGSAVLEQGKTRVAAAVYGPREVQGTGRDRCRISCELQYEASATGSSGGRRRIISSRTPFVRDMVEQITSILNDLVLRELYPNSAIQIRLHVLTDDGSVLCALLNAVSCALVSASVPIKDMLSACSSTWLQDRCFIDATEQESLASAPGVTMAILPNSGKVALLSSDFVMDAERFDELTRAALDGARQVHSQMAGIARERAAELLKAGAR